MLILCGHERLRDVAPLVKEKGRIVRWNNMFLYSGMGIIGLVESEACVRAHLYKLERGSRTRTS